MKVKFKKFDKEAKMPKKAHESDFCYDVWAVSEEEIAPNVWKYGLGFGLQIDREDGIRIGSVEEYDSVFLPTAVEDGLWILESDIINLSSDFRPRSSVWRTGMSLANCQPTIDENYNGEIFLVFYHVMPNMPRYKVGDKIAQMKLGMAFPIEFKEVKELEQTDRGANGFGSSDLK